MDDRGDTDDVGERDDSDEMGDRDDSGDSNDRDDNHRFPFRRQRIDRHPGQMRAFRLAYDGRSFRGFQRQPDVPTVEDALFDALRALDVWTVSDSESDAGDEPDSGTTVEPDHGRPDRPPGYAAAGRTDAGVSALTQTVAFACPAWLTPSALNSRLPASIRAWASADVDPTFHATHDAVQREYTYFLHAPTPDDGASKSIDDERVRTALRTLTGQHDFHNLTPDDEGAVRTLRATVDRDGDFLVVRAAADGFPREFVRRLARLLESVGAGTVDSGFVDRVLDSKPLTGAAGVGPAPPEPLVLSGVRYPDCEFEPDSDAVASTADVFGARHSAALANARVAGFVRDGIADGNPTS
jgi:tRNA pseudouridine38-40 synthase